MARKRRKSCFGKVLKSRIRELNWSQYELSYRSGVHVSTINKICKHGYEPLMNTASALSLSVGLPLQKFVDASHSAFSEVIPFEEYTPRKK